MRRKLLLASLALLGAIGCTSSDHEYFRNHIVLLQKAESHTKTPRHKEGIEGIAPHPATKHQSPI